MSRVALLATVGMLLLGVGCSSSGSGQRSGGAPSSATSGPATTGPATTEPPAALPVDGSCDLSGDGTALGTVESTCLPSCTAALAMADAGTNPAMGDVLDFDSAYVRLTDASGREPEAGKPLALGDAVVELASVHTDRTDPNVPERSGWYTRWASTGASASDANVVYDLWWIDAEDEVDLSYGSDGSVTVQHPLRETAQFLATPVGCLINPDRAADASNRPGPGSPGLPDDGSPSASTGQTGDEGPQQFELPSGNIGCYLSDGSARCDILERNWEPPSRPADCDLDWGNVIEVSGAAAGFTCTGDTAMGGEILPYGSSAQRGDLRCESAETGVTCTNTRTGHGFSMSKNDYRLY